MKEMNWTREEALKRLTFLFKSAEEQMEYLAVSGVKEHNKRLREEMLEDAVEHKKIIEKRNEI